MSLDLHDQRVKLTPEAHAVLSAQTRLTGKDRSEICREILHAWALEKIKEFNLTRHALENEGIVGTSSDKR
jgi:predicted DNA-binding protein